MSRRRFIETRTGQKVTLIGMSVGLVLCALAGAWLGHYQPEVTGGQSHRETLPLCEESAERPCYDDFGDTVQYDRTMVPIGATVYEDGSWVSLDGSSGCLEGGLCQD
jgi:hypothetical protein